MYVCICIYIILCVYIFMYIYLVMFTHVSSSEYGRKAPLFLGYCSHQVHFVGIVHTPHVGAKEGTKQGYAERGGREGET